MTSQRTVENERMRKKLINFPQDSLRSSPQPSEVESSKDSIITSTATQTISDRNNKRKEQVEDEQELAQIFSSKWIETKALRRLEAETGKRYKRGKFSRLEEERVRARVQSYLRENHMTDDAFRDALVTGARESKSAFRNFFVQMAMELPGRPVITVYHYLRRLYHPGNKQGAWLPEEDLHLRRLFAIHGPQWQVISQELGRFNHSCRDRYRWIREQFRKGPWQPDEIDRLRQAVQDRVRSPPSSSENGSIGAWAWIAEKVETRSWHQCLTKWTNSLSFRERHPGVRVVRWTREQDLILLNRIYDLVVEDESEIVWGRLVDDSWNNWTPNKLRMRWRLLRKRVRNERVLDMDTLVETLINSLSSLTPDRVPKEEGEEEEEEMV